MEVYVSKALEEDRLEVHTSQKCRRYGALVPNDKYEWVKFDSFFDYYYKLISKANSIVDMDTYENVLMLKMVKIEGLSVTTEIEKVVFDSRTYQDSDFMEGISRLMSYFNENKTRTLENVTGNIAVAQERHIKPIFLETMKKFIKDGEVTDLAEEDLELVRAYIDKNAENLSKYSKINYTDSKYENYYYNAVLATVVLILIAIISSFVTVFSIPYSSESLTSIAALVTLGSGACSIGVNSLGHYFAKKNRQVAIENLKLELDRIYQEEKSDSKDTQKRVTKRKLKNLSQKIKPADDFLLKDIYSLIQLIYRNPYDGCRENLISILEIAKNYTQNVQDSEISARCLQSYVILKRKIYESLGIKFEISSQESTELIDSISEGIAIIDDEKPKTHVISPITKDDQRKNN